MKRYSNQTLTQRAQELRKNMTEEERYLWYHFLKDLPVPVKRQRVIGVYIVDFYCPAAKIAIELDGSQHFEETNAAYDAERDAFLKSMGITVLRYANSELKNDFRGVCQDIGRHILPEKDWS